MPKVAHLVYGDRKVFTVSSFNRGVGMFLGRLPAVWVEGEVTELRRNDAWANVFLTLKDPQTGATLKRHDRATRSYDRLALALEEGETVHVAGRAELYEQKGELGLRATTIERLGLGAHLVALEQLKRKLAAEGLFAAERKRPLPRLPRAVGILTGADAAARGDLVATIGSRFPAARIVVCETRVQGKGAAGAIVSALRALAAHPDVDVVVLARGGGSFEDLLPFSDEARRARRRGCAASRSSPRSGTSRTRRSAISPPTSRAATPTAAACARRAGPRASSRRPRATRRRLGLAIRARSSATRARLERSGRADSAPRRAPPRPAQARGLDRSGARLQALSPLATLNRGYAIVRAGGGALRNAAAARPGRPP